MTDGVALLDVNVLVAFLWRQHVHNGAARRWFANARLRGWATCPITEMGFVRLFSGRAVGPGTRSVSRSAEALARFLDDDLHQFWPDDVPLSGGQFAASLPHIQGPRQLTDRYLLALAAAHNGTLATFDRAVAAGLPADSPLLAHLEVIED